MMANNIDFVNTAKSQVGNGYAWAAQGEVLTPAHLAELVRKKGRDRYYFKGYSAEKWLNMVCFDCSGLVIWSMQQLGLFKRSEDYSADTLWRKHITAINKGQLLPGDLLFRYSASSKKMVHVGIYIGNNQAVEAKGTKYGVVITSLPGDWTHYGRLKKLPYDAAASTPAEPQPASKTPRTIKKGSKAAADTVKQAQERLNLHGANPQLAVDGSFGPKTDAAVREFQKRKGLEVDGSIGPITWAALLAEPTAQAQAEPKAIPATVRRNSVGEVVKQLQIALNAHGANPALDVDGSYGPKTEAAVKEFQRKNGLTVDGITGPKTWAKLLA